MSCHKNRVKLIPYSQDIKVTHIEVNKKKKTMFLFTSEDTALLYRIELGFQPKGHKQFSGDGKTPEGTYYINEKNPKSVAYKCLYISYPNIEDKKYAESKGEDPGRFITIHGLLNNTEASRKNKHPKKNWTGGCIAVTNTEMDEIYELVKVGTKIIIKP